LHIEFYGTYQKNAYFRAVALIHRPARRSAAVRLLFFLLFIAIYGTFVVTVFRDEIQAAAAVSTVIGHLISFTVAASFAFQPYIAGFTQARKEWSDPLTRLPIQGTVSEQGVTFNPNANPIVIEWQRFNKIKTTEEYTALVTEDKTMLLLQRDFFQTDQEWQTLHQWIGWYVKITR
jgi:hypothetical protein